MLLIHHSDKYGYVIKESVLKFMDSFGLSGMLSLDFFEIEKDTILNNEIRELSKFELRKNLLKNEIESLKIRDDLDINLKKTQIKKLERKLTLDSPFDHIIIASEGEKLLEILSHLAFYDINSDNRIFTVPTGRYK